MSEWIGRVGRLKRVVYARMEQLSFRTGTATFSGVLAVAATAVLLTLIQGSHHAAPHVAQAGATIGSPVVAPPVSGISPSVTHSPHHSRAARPAADYAPRAVRTPTARPEAAPSPPEWSRAHLSSMHPQDSTTIPPPAAPDWPFPTPGQWTWSPQPRFLSGR